MKKIIPLIILLLLFSFHIFSQEKKREDIILLKNGETYRGEIVLKTNDILMLKTHDEKRFQFPINEISKIEQKNNEQGTAQTTDSTINKCFAGIINLSGGISSAPGAFSSSPVMNISMAFGSRNAFGTKAFLGLGIGYESIFGVENSDLDYIPVFIQIHESLKSKNKWSPAFGAKTGYAFAVNSQYKGGPLIQISAGANYKLTETSGMFFGVFSQVRQINGTMTEQNKWGDFTSKGNGALYSAGLTASFIF